jgi:hypothetical protein
MYRVRRFAPSPARVLDKFPHGERFFSPYGKNLSPPCGKSSNQSIKNQNMSKNIKNENFKILNPSPDLLESLQINSGIVKTPFYFMRLSL